MIFGPELCQYSQGSSEKVFFGFVDVGMRSVDVVIVRYCQLVLHAVVLSECGWSFCHSSCMLIGLFRDGLNEW